MPVNSLINFIKEVVFLDPSFIKEGYAKISTEDQVMDSAEQLFAMCKQDQNLKEKILKKDTNGDFFYTQGNPLVYFPSFFKVESRSKEGPEVIFVDVAFFMDDPGEKLKSAATHKRLYNNRHRISLNFENIQTMSIMSFKKDILHELVHAIDPFSNKEKEQKKYTAKKYHIDIDDNQNILNSKKFQKLSGEEKDEIYHNLTYEFTAFVSEIAFEIKSRTRGDSKKIEVMKNLIFFLMNNPQNVNEEMSDREIEYSLDAEEAGIFSDFEDYMSFADPFKNKVAFWSKNPKNKKKLQKYLGQAIFDSAQT
jgi:hypothetical protein